MKASRSHFLSSKSDCFRWDGSLSLWICDDDHVLTSNEVLGYVTQSPIDLASNSTMNGFSIRTENDDQDTLGQLTCSNNQVAIYDEGISGWICGDSSDTLDSLSCSTGQIPYFENGSWTCQTLQFGLIKMKMGISSLGRL